RFHLVDFEGYLAGPGQALDGKRFAAARAPAAARAADDEGAVSGEFDGDDARAEPLAERIAGALISAVRLFFERDAHDRAVGLIADEELFFEGAELATGQVAFDAAGGLAHALIREEDRGGHELRNLLRFDMDAAAALGDLRRLGPVLC